MKTKILYITLLILAGLFIYACSEESSEPKINIYEVQSDNGFVGTLTGTNAFVALLIADNEAIVFVCDSDENIFEWFDATISKPTEMNLTNSAGAKVSGTFTGNSFDGEVTLRNGNKHVFSAKSNTGNITGIFRVLGEEAIQDKVSGGWVVNSVGEERSFIRVNSEPYNVSLGTTKDGTSNTILISQKEYIFGRWYLSRSAGSVSIIAPNNIVSPGN